jgi:predicted metal-dependent hydrolase
MKKSERIETFVRGLGMDADSGWHPCYRGYFECFNDGSYYEAHDVLEHLWLEERQNTFYKGLIQLAGAFVHLKKQRARPDHPTDGRRLQPASRLFQLAQKNLQPCPRVHMGLDLDTVRKLIHGHLVLLEDGKFEINPWNPECLPRLRLMSLEE